MHFGVRVAAIENGIIRFQGTRRLGYEQGRLEQQMQSSGFVSLRDIGRDRSVLSRNVADLQIVIIGRPQEQRENLQLKQEPPANPADPPVIRADMTDSEKQRLLLDYLNRLLGETGTVLP
jgi:flagellar L-ring protein precursor FlgH